MAPSVLHPPVQCGKRKTGVAAVCGLVMWWWWWRETNGATDGRCILPSIVEMWMWRGLQYVGLSWMVLEVVIAFLAGNKC